MMQTSSYHETSDIRGEVQPNAVSILTIHSAKGLEFPAVFIPCLVKNRFPSTYRGGRTKWHVLPRQIITDSSRYDTNESDERRLFYVAMSRAQKYLYCSWAPTEKPMFQQVSPFFQEFAQQDHVSTTDRKKSACEKLMPQQKAGMQAGMTVSFSELKNFWSCAYRFKLRHIYGFDAPFRKEMGFGSSIHDAVAELHKKAIQGISLSPEDVPLLIERHLHLPYADPSTRAQMKSAAIMCVRRYIQQHGSSLIGALHAEQPVDIRVGDVTATGRINLIKNIKTGELSICDFKTSENAPDEIHRLQLHSYAIGYRDWSGATADLIEVHHLGENGTHVREQISEDDLSKTEATIKSAAENIRANRFVRLPVMNQTCEQCDHRKLCRPEKFSS